MSLPESCCSSLKTSLLWGTGVETSLLSVEWAWCSQMYIICWMFDGLSMTPFLYRNHSWSHHRPRSSCDAGDVQAANYWCVVLFPLAYCLWIPDRCAELVGNYKTKVLFEKADSDDNGETTVLQNWMHPSQQKFFDFEFSRYAPFPANYSVLSL